MSSEKKELVLLARREYRKNRKDNVTIYLLLGIACIASLLFMFFIIMTALKLTGQVSSVSSQAGYITELVVTATRAVTQWGGFYGLALRVPGFTEQNYKDLGNGTIVRADVFFDCIQSDVTGGPEIYASMNSSIDFLGSITPATTQMVDQVINCTGKGYCANNTYVDRMNVTVGSTVITDVPSTATFKYDGMMGVFRIGILNFSNKLVFVTPLNASVQQGYSSSVTVNYQMLLPVPESTSQRYYFFTDPDDFCPSGGLGNTINSSVFGYSFDDTGNILPNVSVTVAGYSTVSDSLGFFNVSFLVVPGTYNIIGQKEGYDPSIDNITVSFSVSSVHKNITLYPVTQAVGATKTPRVFGSVTDTSSTPLADASVYFGNASTLSVTNGSYSFYPTLTVGQNAIVSIKEGYDNYYAIITVNSSTNIIEHNIVLVPANENTQILGPFPTGPFTQEPKEVQKIIEEVEKKGEDFWVSTSEIVKEVRQNTFVEEKIALYNFKDTGMRLVFTLSSNLSDFITLDKSILGLSPNQNGELILTIYGTKPIGRYKGSLLISGDISKEIPITIDIVEKKFPIESLLMEILLNRPSISPGSKLKYTLNLKNLLIEQNYKINLQYLITDLNETQIITSKEQDAEIRNTLTIIDDIDIPQNTTEGKYIFKVNAKYFNLLSSVSVPITIARPIYAYSFFGIPLWIIFLGISLISIGALNVYLYKHYQEKKKRYHLKLELDTLPKAGLRSIKVGRLAETNTPAYVDLDALTTHAIVAGATGGGKSISAQVIVEEALMKNIAVVVFDPTAQWSGMLRKCEDKRMLSLYPKFGLKPTDARPFPGNLKMITNARQAIDIKKYINPGQIQIFAMNKLDPSDIDKFVESAIISIFRSSPEEHPGLRVMLVFDEVHRLLPKFGGTGKGFLQIERACREFRKWGFGVMLVSQVLSDFVGEIKANINTEVQMRVAEENDLERVKERYGIEALKSLVRADVGVAMMQNAEYNKGMPYFVAYRPILHNTRRLSDEILERYNAYSDVIEDLEYQIEQLDAEKVDTFDMKMELKLVKDKLMTGNFTVVDIYLEGLKPRFEKQWQVLGKKPKKLQLQLLAEKDIAAAAAAAAKDKKDWELKNAVAQEKKEEKKEDIKKKIVKPIILDNGATISSLQELQDFLPTLEQEIFNIHVNKNKNDFAVWIEKQVDPALAAIVAPLKDKKSIVDALIGYPANLVQPKEEKKEDKSADKEKKDTKPEEKPVDKDKKDKAEDKKEEKK